MRPPAIVLRTAQLVRWDRSIANAASIAAKVDRFYVYAFSFFLLRQKRSARWNTMPVGKLTSVGLGGKASKLDPEPGRLPRGSSTKCLAQVVF